MELLTVIMVLTLGAFTADTEALNPSINWWVSAADKNGTNALAYALTSVQNNQAGIEYPLISSLDAIYLCCNIFKFIQKDEGLKPTLTKKFSDEHVLRKVSSYRSAFKDVKLLAHVQIDYRGMMRLRGNSNVRFQTIYNLAQYTQELDLDGLIIDYEPQMYTRKHAYVYRRFLDEFAAEMASKNLISSACISSWGILKYYDIFGKSKVNRLLSMGSTYYGRDVEFNMANVDGMLQYIETSRLEIGLGLMHPPGTVKLEKRDYKWNEKDLKRFLQWLTEQGITELHIWPGEWKAHHKAQKFFLRALAENVV